MLLARAFWISFEIKVKVMVVVVVDTEVAWEQRGERLRPKKTSPSSACSLLPLKEHTLGFETSVALPGTPRLSLAPPS